MILYTTIPSPLGPLLATGCDEGLTGLYTPGHGRMPAPDWQRVDAAFTDVRAQVEAYFAGRLHQFDVQLAPQGTPFQQLVWQALRRIPYGKTCGYGELASTLGRPGAARAVGLANGRNPVSIIVPCHRVVGARGALTGYAGGVGAKRFLLEHERAHLSASRAAASAEL